MILTSALANFPYAGGSAAVGRSGPRGPDQGWVYRPRELGAVSSSSCRTVRAWPRCVRDPRPWAAVRRLRRGERLACHRVRHPHRSRRARRATEPRVPLLARAQPPPVHLGGPRSTPAAVYLDHAAVTWRGAARRARLELAAAAWYSLRAPLDDPGFGPSRSRRRSWCHRPPPAGRACSMSISSAPRLPGPVPAGLQEQAIVAFSEDRVGGTGPVFRAEPDDTTRHLAEYVSLDAELGFIRDHRDVLAVLRQALAGVTAALRTRRRGPAADLLGIMVRGSQRTSRWSSFHEALRQSPGPSAGISPRPRARPRTGHRPMSSADARRRPQRPSRAARCASGPFYARPQPSDERSISNGFDLLFHGQELVTDVPPLHRFSDYLGGDPGGRRGARRGRAATWRPLGARGCRRHARFRAGSA